MLAITVLGDVPRPETMQESLEFHRKALAVDERLVGATPGANAKYTRALLLDRMNVALILNEMADYRGAVENARAGQPLLASLRTDANNTQVRVDSANLAWPLGRGLLALGEISEARKVFEQYATVLAQLAAESDTLKVQYLRGTMAYGLAEVHSRLASGAGNGSCRTTEALAFGKHSVRRSDRSLRPGHRQRDARSHGSPSGRRSDHRPRAQQGRDREAKVTAPLADIGIAARPAAPSVPPHASA